MFHDLIIGVMAGWVTIPHRIAAHIHVAVIVKEIGRIRYEGVRGDELAQVGVKVAGIVIHQAAAVHFLAGEAVVGGQGAAAAVATIAPVALFSDKGAAVV
jgi:hypothetical protein